MPKKFGVGEIFKSAFEFLKKEPGVIGLCALPLVVNIVAFVLFFGPGYLIWPYKPVAMFQSLTVWILYFIYAIAAAILGCAVMAAIILKVNAAGRKKKLGLAEALRLGLLKVPRLFVAMLAYALIAGAGFIAFIVPGIYLAVRLMLWLPAAVLENKSFGLKSAWAASKGNWWSLFALGLLLMLLSFVAFIPLVGLFISSLFVAPITYVALTLAYLKLKTT